MIYLVLVILIIVFFGFSGPVRKYIFWRDGGTCQECGRAWNDGWMLHAAHNNHCYNGGGAALYNDPANGKLLCVDCHIAQHRRFFNETSGTERDKNAQAIRKLQQLDRHNYNYYKSKS